MNRSLTGKHTTALQKDSLIVSVHDVSPRTLPACRTIVAELRELGVQCCSLLVVPDHHGRGHFLDDPVFCDWLRAEVAAGSEAVVHGYRHHRPRRKMESWITRLWTQVYTADEGEFYDLDQPTSTALVRQAREEFGRIGLAADGFIAPAWLLGQRAEAGVREAGSEYTTRLGSVMDLKSGRTFPAQSLVWSVRSAWRRQVSRWWNASLYRRVALHRLIRVSIHPVDIEHPAIWRQIRGIIVMALKDRSPSTYERWITRQRALALRPG